MNSLFRTAANSRRQPGLEIADPVLADFGVFLRSLREQGKRTFVILSNPASAVFDPHGMLSRVTGTKVHRDFDKRNLEFDRPIIGLVRTTAEAAGATVLDPIPYSCGESACPTADDEWMPVYKDEHHARPSYLARRATFIDRIFSP